MCGRFYIDEETVKEVERTAGRIDWKTEKLGDFIFGRNLP